MDSEQAALLDRPGDRTDDAVYSNFDHALAAEIVRQLEARPGELYAQHAAWNFCGYVWRLPDGRWVDQVWRWNAPVEDIIGGSIEFVIGEANDRYGAE